MGVGADAEKSGYALNWRHHGGCCLSLIVLQTLSSTRLFYLSYPVYARTLTLASPPPHESNGPIFSEGDFWTGSRLHLSFAFANRMFVSPMRKAKESGSAHSVFPPSLSTLFDYPLFAGFLGWLCMRLARRNPMKDGRSLV